MPKELIISFSFLGVFLLALIWGVVDTAIVQTLLEDQAIPGRQIGHEWRTTLRALVSYVDGVPIQGESSCCVPMQCCTPEGDNTGVIKCCVPGDSGCC